MSINGTGKESRASIRRDRRTSHNHLARRRRSNQDGFTLVELLIVVTITPMIVGALALALVSMFTLQTSVGNRLADSGEAQVLQSTYRVDVGSAQEITTESTDVGGQCGTGTQLLGLEWNGNTSHSFQTVVSYMSVAATSGTSTTYSLVRDYCNAGASTTPTTSTVIVPDLSGAVSNVIVNCVTAPCDPDPSSGWISAQDVENITFPITETNSNESITLVADPATSGSTALTGGPITVTTSTGCGYAAANSGNYSSSLCLIDFSSLTGNNLLAAEQGCLETSVPLPGGSTMYYCIQISGAPVVPAALPTWTNGFLGNPNLGAPFYIDIPGDPALYQDCEGDATTCTVNGVAGVPNTWGGQTVINISNIEVLGPNGLADKGWEFVSADAESTDSGESISWTSDAALSIIPNGESGQLQPVGNACLNGETSAGLAISNGGMTVTCYGTAPTASGITLKSSAAKGATSIVVSTTSGLAVGDYLILNNGGSDSETVAIAQSWNGTSTTVPLVSALGNSHSSGESLTFTEPGVTKTGTAMIEALAPKSMKVTLIGTGLEGVSFGLLF